MGADYVIQSLGNHALPDDLSRAGEDDVEAVIRRAAAAIGLPSVEVRRVTSVIGGTCLVCTDVVASVAGVPALVARPALF